MSDIASITAAPRDFTVADRTYQVSPLRLKDIGTLAAYLKDVIPHPVATLKPDSRGVSMLEGMGPEDRQFAFNAAFAEARENWPPRVESAAGQRVLCNTAGGRIKLLEVSLGRYQPDISQEQYRKLDEVMTDEDWLEFMDLTAGREPKVPNSEAETTKTTPTH